MKAKAKRLVVTTRAALAELFDQSKPFGRLALVHSLMSAAATAMTVGLAGSLFFAISPTAAEGKVLLYLGITIAPFAVVAPALSPLLDKGRQARRTATTVAACASALLCIAMAADIKSLLLFPEAFGILVMSKLYLVTKAALVPAVTAPGEDLASANARLAVLAGVAGFLISPFAVAFLQAGAQVVMVMAAILFGATTVAAVRLPRGTREEGSDVAPVTTAFVDQPGIAPAAYQPPAPQHTSTSRRRGPGAGLVKKEPIRFEPRPQAPSTYGPLPPAELPSVSSPGGSKRRSRLLGQLAPRMDVHAPEVTLSLAGVSTLRAAVGFVTFFLAFALKRETPPAATWLYGLIVIAAGIGGLGGSFSVPFFRRHLSEERIIMFSLVLAAVFAGLCGFSGGLWAQPLLTAVIAFTGTTSKPSFDSIAQRHIPPLQQGRAFAKFETRLQLVWVIAAVMGVVIKFSFGAGDIVIGVACAISAIFYASMSQSVHHHEHIVASSGGNPGHIDASGPAGAGGAGGAEDARPFGSSRPASPGGTPVTS